MIYLDNAATTKVFDECNSIINDFNTKYFYNPSALYNESVYVSREMNGARAVIASLLNCSPEEVFFTSGATESNNTVLFCAHKNKKGCIITTQGEHPSVYNAAAVQANKGNLVIFLPLNGDGTVNAAQLDTLTDISLVSIIHVSNETGSVNNIEELTKKIKKNNPSAIIHSDGVQAAGKIDTDVKRLGVDLYSISGHKLHAPKGIGALYVRKGVNITPFIYGGGQERNMRSGTENTAAIMAFAAAVKKRITERDNKYVKKLKDIFLKELRSEDIIVNSDSKCVPNIISLSVKDIRGEVLLHALEKHNVLIGTGSACSSRYSDNRVLSGMGINENMIKSSIRLSFDEYTAESDVVAACGFIRQEITELRGALL